MSLLKLERLMNTVFSFHFYVTQFSSLHVNNPYYKIQIGSPVSKTFCFSFFFPFKCSVDMVFLRSCAYHNSSYFKKQMDYLSWRQVFSTIMFVHALVLFILDGLVPVINSFQTKKKLIVVRILTCTLRIDVYRQRLVIMASLLKVTSLTASRSNK